MMVIRDPSERAHTGSHLTTQQISRLLLAAGPSPPGQSGLLEMIKPARPQPSGIDEATGTVASDDFAKAVAQATDEFGVEQE